MTSKFRRKSGSINDARIAGLYDLEHTIGKGHFAVVKLARHVFTGEKVCFELFFYIVYLVSRLQLKLSTRRKCRKIQEKI